MSTHLISHPTSAAARKETAGGIEEIGVLIVGHGTRQVAGQQQFLRLAAEFATAVKSHPDVATVQIEPVFLELAEPTIETGVRNLAAKGVKRLIVVPVLLFSAGHAKFDIPEAVAAAASPLGLEIVEQTPPLQSDRRLIELSRTRFCEAVRPANLQCLTDCPNRKLSRTEIKDGDPQFGSSNFSIAKSVPEDVALVMIGRGAGDPTAIDAMRNVVDMRIQACPVAWNTTGFFVGGSPTVEEALKQAAAQSHPIVVVQPHLFFDGELLKSLGRMVQDWQIAQPHRRWLIADVLGRNSQLAELFCNLAVDAVVAARKRCPSSTPGETFEALRQRCEEDDVAKPESISVDNLHSGGSLGKFSVLQRLLRFLRIRLRRSSN